MTVRARYAPAPSGDKHVGNVRTALFNWAFARHEGGTFIVRIEDTDPVKHRPELIESTLEMLRWIGIDWDEGPDVGGPHAPYRQSERRPLHERTLQELVDGDHVYRCWCTRDDIRARGVKTGYDRFCRARTDEPEGPYALRFKVPERREVVVRDVIRGEVRTAYEDMQDFVVARSDGSPTFVVANASDDIAMEITHAIRGADLLSAAAQTTLVFEALGAEPPAYAHLPLILGPDRSRLGARHGAVGTLTYRDQGYLPEALLNYLALLGWSSPSGDEILDRDRLVREFTLDRVIDSPAVFDHDKLAWMNGEYLKALSPDDLEARVLELAPDVPKDVLRQVIDLELVQTRARTLGEIPEAIRYLHERPAIDPKAAEKWLGADEQQETLRRVADLLESLEPWTPETIQEGIQGVIEDLGLHRRKGPKPIFVAISGSEVALPIFQSIFVIGQEESVARLLSGAGGA